MKKSLKNLTALTLSSALAVGIITASLGPGKLSDKTLITAKANSIGSEFDPEDVITTSNFTNGNDAGDVGGSGDIKF